MGHTKYLASVFPLFVVALLHVDVRLPAVVEEAHRSSAQGGVAVSVALIVGGLACSLRHASFLQSDFELYLKMYSKMFGLDYNIGIRDYL